MCAHKQFKTFSEVRALTPGNYELWVFVTCAECGTPMKFTEGAVVRAMNRGLSGVIPCQPAGD